MTKYTIMGLSTVLAALSLTACAKDDSDPEPVDCGKECAFECANAPTTDCVDTCRKACASNNPDATSTGN